MEEITISSADLAGAASEVTSDLEQRLIRSMAANKALLRAVEERDARIAELEAAAKTPNRAQRRAGSRKKA
ncbi:MAG: hypothetical protein WD739_07410 [Actinomycetota bacterium]